jgi:hypothetical protein
LLYRNGNVHVVTSHMSLNLVARRQSLSHPSSKT